MKSILLGILLMTPALGWAAKPQPDPASYTIAVHVKASRMPTLCGSGLCNSIQDLTVVIDGKTLELQSGVGTMLLRVGDYKARIAKERTTQPYEYSREYEFLFSDGQTRSYTVIGEQE